MIIKAKAPFRIGLAGGGTDVEPYVSRFGGEVINATLGLYTRVAIETIPEDEVILLMQPYPELNFPLTRVPALCFDARDLFTVTYKRFFEEYGAPGSGLMVTVQSDVPMGSGLGTSSTIMVAIVGALAELYQLPWEKDAIAAFAADTERRVLGWAGGLQDQYAAVMGGFNHMRFRKDGTIDIVALPIDPTFISLLEQSILLYHTRQQRHSSQIIQEQQERVRNDDEQAIEATHAVKALVPMMRDALTRGDIRQFASLLNEGYTHKKHLANGIATPLIDEVIHAAMKAGALGAKISGAGGGGFITLVCMPASRMAVREALSTFDGQFYDVYFTAEGLATRKQNYG